jgi:hypothetical protein
MQRNEVTIASLGWMRGIALVPLGELEDSGELPLLGQVGID